MTNAEDFDLDEFSPYLVNVLASRMSRRLSAVYGDRFNVTIPEWRIMSHLAQNKKVSVREIHRKVDMDKSKVSRAAAQLEQHGILEKRPNPSDRRLVEMNLTRRGRRLFEQIAPLALEFEADALDILSAEEKLVFNRIIKRLNDALTANGEAAGNGL